MKFNKKIYSTPSQTVGPFFRNHLNFKKKKFPFSEYNNINLKFKNAVINGNIFYNEKNILKDGFIEYFQEVYYNGKKNLLNFNRICSYNKNINKYTIKIKQYDNLDYANNVNLIIFSRGLLNHLYTKIFFEDEVNYRSNTFYKNISNKRKYTLMAKLVKTNNNIKYYSFNIFLNGVNETFFFNNYQLD